MNKNTKQVRNQIRKAGKTGAAFVETQVPVRNYHSCQNTLLTKVNRPTAFVGADKIVSSSKKRNMAMRVFRNKNELGKSSSLTVHAPLDPERPVVFKGHGYIADKRLYRQPPKFRGRVN